jgi:hypothetical protein
VTCEDVTLFSLKGYCVEDLVEVVRRYVPKAEARALLDELKVVKEQGAETNAEAPPPNTEPGTGENGG